MNGQNSVAWMSQQQFQNLNLEHQHQHHHHLDQNLLTRDSNNISASHVPPPLPQSLPPAFDDDDQAAAEIHRGNLANVQAHTLSLPQQQQQQQQLHQQQYKTTAYQQRMPQQHIPPPPQQPQESPQRSLDHIHEPYRGAISNESARPETIMPTNNNNNNNNSNGIVPFASATSENAVVSGDGCGGIDEKSLTSGIARLVDDLRKIVEDAETADIVFLIGRKETPLYAHRVMLRARCRNFQNLKRGEICKIFGVTVSPIQGGNGNVIRWPHANVEVLREVLLFIYTGKVNIQETHIFEAIAQGSELGLDELVRIYERHANSHITVSNACDYLDAALCLKRRLNETDWNRIVQMCMKFISEHVAECAKTQSFLNMSKQGITHLISSDSFSMDEADVFRCVLAWAKHKTGVTQPTEMWNDDDRARICQQLSGVIDHIRVLLIDSQVFAEEVEPTGVIPIELSLERYRFAALAAGGGGGAGKSFTQDRVHATLSMNKRAQRRAAPPATITNRCKSSMFFANSKLMLDDESGLEKQCTLNAWYGSPKQRWKLLFRASAHGFSAQAFHLHCDGHSPTYVLVQGSRGFLSGGFTDIAWSRGDGKGRGRYVPSDKSFLFTLHCPDGSVPAPSRYDCRKRQFAVTHHANYGPVFGAGADLSIANHCHLSDASYSNLPHSYDGDNASSAAMFGDYNFTVLDYEVFTLAD